MKKYNLSNIMKRAWELVKKLGMTISSGLKKAWEEAKEMKKNLVEELKANLESMTYGDYHINLGTDRQVQSKVWEKNEIAYERQNDANIHNFIPSCKGLLQTYWNLSIPERNKALKYLLDSVEYKKYNRNQKGHKDDASFDLTIKPRIPRI